MKYFEYGQEEMDYLKERDPILGQVIDHIGRIERETRGEIFPALVSSVISQQISTKAALTVQARLLDLAGDLSPQALDRLDVEAIQQCGMSMRKAGYIKAIGQAALDGTIDFGNLYKLSDEEVIRELTQLKGVGEWTAEMLLIFALERPDILSYKDLAIRRGIMRLYKLEDLTLEEFRLYKKRYSPYSTVASLYLWEVASRDQYI